MIQGLGQPLIFGKKSYYSIMWYDILSSFTTASADQKQIKEDRKREREKQTKTPNKIMLQ